MNATSAPLRASSRHTARPMPRLPPVTRAFLSTNSRLDSPSLIALSRLPTKTPMSSSQPSQRQVLGLDLLALGSEPLERRMIDHLSLDHDVDHVGHGFGEIEVLLHQQETDTFVSQSHDQASEFLHHQRREALRRLVEQDHAGVSDQRAGNREHLLLAAGELGSLAAPALGERGK